MNPEVVLKIDALDNTKAAFSSVKTSLSGLEKSTASFRDKVENLQPAFKKMAVAGTATAAAVGFAIKGMVTEGLQSAQIAESFSRMTTQMGYSGDELISKLREVSAGTVDTTNLMLASNKAMALGVGTDIETMTTLMEIARVKGRALGLDTTQAFNDIVTGIGRGSPLILDNLGITIKLGEAQERYAETLGKTTAELTDAEKKNALLNAVLESGRAELEQVGEVTITSAERMQQLSAEFSNMRSPIGEAFLPVLEQLVQAISPLLERLSAWISQNPELARNILIGTAAVAGLVAAVGALGIALLAINPVSVIIIGAITGISLAVYAIRNAIEQFGALWGATWDLIKVAASNAWEWIRDKAIGPMIEGFEKVLRFISRIRDGMESIGAKVGSSVSSAGSSISRLLGSVTPFANGGIVTKPTLGLVGEAGPEAIIPLSKAGALGGGITINISGTFLDDRAAARRMGDEIMSTLKQQMRL
ncbi:hypothetical protein K7H22_13675 [Seohaeicola saemankumensis]|uniref:hypothetical protein n=1 Tax=Seohaeicola saemankumensis TaxID=481181 RepID=UPI002E7BD339|nr:hypothetical protein [Seohaeicola saemankumensis]MCD1627046.1 hypothetical protein [Seohaeicola saemankumensis]